MDDRSTVFGDKGQLAKRLVRRKLADLNLNVKFGGRLVRMHQPVSPMDGLRTQVLSWRDVEESLTLDAEVLVNKIPARLLTAAISQVRSRLEARDRQAILKPLIRKPSPTEVDDAALKWKTLCTRAFDTDPRIVEATLKQFIHTTKRRACGFSTTRQIMPLIVSNQQGAGKSEFVKYFLKPIADLCGYMSLAEAIDDRQEHVLSLSGIVVDDVDPLTSKKALASFKRLVTLDTVRRRILGTSKTLEIPIRATFIGSANSDVGALFQDPSGHRRLVALRFRNGDVDRGGDPLVWQAITSADMALLWKSVDLEGPAPIDSIWAELASHQETNILEASVQSWLRGLVLGSPTVYQLISNQMIPASALHELYQSQTNTVISPKRFGSEMRRLSLCYDDLPFGVALHCRTSNMYPIRPRSGPQS